MNDGSSGVVAAVARAGAGRAARPSRPARASACPLASGDLAEQRPQQRGLAGAVRARGWRAGPATPPRGRSGRAGTSRAPRRRRSSRATTSPARVAAFSSSWSCHGSHGLSTTSRRSMAFSVALTFDAIFSERCDLRCGMNLSLSVFLALAFFTPVHGPLPLGPLALLEPVPLGGELLVALLLLPAGQLARRRRSRSSRRRARRRRGRGIAELEDPGDDAVEEGPVVRHGRRPPPAWTPRTPRAGRGRRSRGRWWARRAAARPGGTGGWRPARPGPPGPPDRWPTSTSSRSAGRPTWASTAPVRASRSSPPRARKRSRAVAVGLDRRRRRRPWPPCAASSAADGRGHAGAPGQVGAQASRPASASGSCGRQPTVVVAGDRSTDAAVGRLEPGEDPQQRRLADAVRPHDPERVPGVIDTDTPPSTTCAPWWRWMSLATSTRADATNRPPPHLVVIPVGFRQDPPPAHTSGGGDGFRW